MAEEIEHFPVGRRLAFDRRLEELAGSDESIPGESIIRPSRRGFPPAFFGADHTARSPWIVDKRYSS
jgi:hypothetical protein